mmetsp:Transcript_18302/g.50803  ORF Transcript_18302/g.50803 Transcript_18302/m.50803 type:complete len:231 (-) Transcript_18302:571-1263(-)
MKNATYMRSSMDANTLAQSSRNFHSAPGNLTSVAERIHQRALELQRAQEDLVAAKAQLAEVEARHEVQQQTHRRVRAKLLASSRARDGAELELYRAQDSVEQAQQDLIVKQEGIERIRQQVQTSKTEWEEQVENLYAKHQVKQEIYSCCLQGVVSSQEVKLAHLRERKEALKQEATERKRQKKLMAQKRKRLRKEIEEMESSELASRNENSALSEAMKMAMSKVRISFLA